MDHMLKFHFVLFEEADDLIADILASKEEFGLDPIPGNPFRVGGEEGSFPDVF